MNGGGMTEDRSAILQKVADAPKSFHDLLIITRSNYSELTKTLEMLMSEGLVEKTSDGFQTLYYATNHQSKSNHAR